MKRKDITMYEIIEYEQKYEDSLRKLWINVCVEEFGFEEWRSEINIIEDNKYEKLLIAISNDEVVGSMAYMNKGNNVAEIKRVYVYSEYRGSGLSQRLLDLTINEIQNKGYERIFIETWSKFNRGINFYTKNKFVFKEQVGECYRYERKI